MAIRLIYCGSGNVHLILPCYNCYATQGGLMMGTVTKTHKSRLTAKCPDCGKTAEYFIDASKEKVWKLEPIKARGYRNAA